jgi:LacI family transcriptional regulator
MATIKGASLDRSNSKSYPLYEQIRDHLRQTIEDESIPPGDRLPAISSLAREWDVNYRTIRTAVKMLEDDGLVDYLPRRGAVVTGRSATQHKMLFLRRCPSRPFLVRIGAGLTRYAQQAGHEAIIVETGRDHKSRINTILHPPEGVEGMVIFPHNDQRYRHAVEQAVAKGLKVVFVDRGLFDMEISTVSADHYASGYMGTLHLLETHERPVHYVGTPAMPESQTLRVGGWEAAMAEFGYHQIDEYLWELDEPETVSTVKTFAEIFENARRAADRMFEAAGNDPPLSVFAGNDYVAKGVYLAAEQRGLSVGEDVFVIGYGDLPIASRLDPPLTSFSQSPERLGYEAARLLEQELNGQVRTAIRRVLPVELKVRRSSIIETS